jgi:hypothetical protein
MKSYSIYTSALCDGRLTADILIAANILDTSHHPVRLMRPCGLLLIVQRIRMSKIGNIRLIMRFMRWFEDVNATTKGIGSDTEISDVGNDDEAYWRTVDTETWRNALKGKVAVTPRDIDR